MSFKIIVKLPSGVDVVLPAALGTPLECWEIKERALLKAPTTLRGIDLFELYEDAAGEVKVATEQAFLSAVTLYAKRIDGACARGGRGACGRRSRGCARIAPSFQHTHASASSLLSGARV